VDSGILHQVTESLAPPLHMKNEIRDELHKAEPTQDLTSGFFSTTRHTWNDKGCQ